MTQSTNELSGISDDTGTDIVALPGAPAQNQDKNALDFVKQHPVLTVAGGLAVGALAAALIPRRNRVYVGRQSSAFADAIGTATLALATQALQKAEAARNEITDRAGTLADHAGKLGEKAGEKAGEIKDKLHR